MRGAGTFAFSFWRLPRHVLARLGTGSVEPSPKQSSVRASSDVPRPDVDVCGRRVVGFTYQACGLFGALRCRFRYTLRTVRIDRSERCLTMLAFISSALFGAVPVPSPLCPPPLPSFLSPPPPDLTPISLSFSRLSPTPAPHVLDISLSYFHPPLCPQFHDGLGFMTTHSLITNTFEYSLQVRG